jgi:hypothetical protein
LEGKVMKLGFFIVDAWVVGIIILTILALSGLIFDAPAVGMETYSPMRLFISRMGVILIWPLALISAGGRRTLFTMMKGEGE